MLKSNHFILGRVLKVAIVLIAALVLFSTLRKFFSDEETIEKLQQLSSQHMPWIIFILILVPVNWFLEAAKWKRLVSSFEVITWKQSWSAVLAGLAIGSATPNRFGEFAGRIFQLKSTPVKDGIVLTLISSAMQVGVTMLFGFAALMMTDPDRYLHSTKAYIWLVIITGVSVIAIGILRNARGKIAEYFSALRKVNADVKWNIFILSAVRYMIYAAQFFLMLTISGVSGSVMDVLPAIMINYLVVTIIPSIMFSELLVRGTVASGVIGSLCGNPGAAALAAVLLWIINVALPAVCGMFFVRNMTFFKTER